MRHSHRGRRSHFWPWHLAYAGHKTQTCESQRHESRWHPLSRGGGDAGFGVRRPLRYLSQHLDLDDNQTRKMATVLNQLKTEREQAQLDTKRSAAALAALLVEGTPTLEETRAVLKPRVESAEQLQEELAKAMVAISSFLDDDQRQELVTLMQSGVISF